MKYEEIDGDLIEMALNNSFDVISHGCNCFCTMGAGIAVPMKNTFRCHTFPMENPTYKGDMNKLGKIDYKTFYFGKDNMLHEGQTRPDQKKLTVVNSYTQYKPGGDKPLDYEALTLCLRKINHTFTGQHIGLPTIGCGLAGGDWNRVKRIIMEELKDCDVTVVFYDKK